ncbi:MAG: hypothetical protein L7T62_03145 [Flavobacteriaceae bacterium]|nr:hypothetical protein [Flavobacteriaceae bacterium]
MFRKFWHRRAYAKDRKKAMAAKDLEQSFKVKKISVILDASLGINRDFFLDLAKQFSIPQTSISFLVFASGDNVDKEYVDFFNKSEISFFGKFSDELSRFCAKEADLQINYFNEENLYFEWVASAAKKRLSVGFSKANHNINDLILDMDPKSTELVKKELVKYLRILKKI